ncbi:hypothetical protein C6502_08875 [Candidatus Poribacteria bacterium]|nr:MAG: hypothetical protein C6502_08875 [Candidatus Poribacteria bacterium]
MQPRRGWLIFSIAVIFIALSNNQIWAQQSTPVETAEEMIEDFAERATSGLKGRVIWDGQDLSQTTVQVYKDEGLKHLYTGVTQLNSGEFEVRVEAGSYYLVAFVDLNRSGKFDIGDGMGIFGITNWNDSNQQKQVVKVADRQVIRGLDIIITARMQKVDGQDQIVSLSDYQEDPFDQFKSALELISSGIKGQVTYEGQESFANALVFAYTDLSWKYRAGETQVAADGSFTLSLPPGKYYLMAIIDSDNTHLFDAGDALGIYGVTDLRESQAFPQPVLVRPNQFVSDLQIAITGKQTMSGQVVPMDGSEMQVDLAGMATAQLTGKVRWTRQSFKGGVIQASQEAALFKEGYQTRVSEDGKFNLQLPPGDYYLIANVDVDGDGGYSLGDGLGGYGTADITTAPPSALTVAAGPNPEITIFVSARYNADGQLEAVAEGAIDLSQDSSGGISGQIRWDGKVFKEGILSISETPDFRSPVAISLNLEDDGHYEVSIPPGDYYVMAVIDLDGDRKSGLQDGVGIYGTRHPVRSKDLQQVSVFSDHITPHIDIEISAMYIDVEGNIAEIEDGGRSEIKLQYGVPEDVFQFTRFGRQIEEWCYWTQGVRFRFEAVGTGWKLQTRKDFEPTPEALEQLKRLEQQPQQRNPDEPETSPLNALLYYSFDDIIWECMPTIGIQQPLAAGRRPTVSLDGRLTRLDLEGNVILHDSDAPQGRLLLTNRELATDVTISPDGAYIAFARQEMERQHIYIRHIASQEEIPIPSTAQEMFTPAWNPTGELLAYSTKGSIENPEAGTDRNIYSYSYISGRVEPISIGPEDDAEPAWSPSDPNLLVFSRAEGQHRQIWLVELGPEGKPNAQQLTRYGGEKPVWLPDGSAILYETNGQLWQISKDASKNRPVMFNGQIVFGHEPYTIPSPIQ